MFQRDAAHKRTLFLIFRRIFFNDFSSDLVSGNLWGTGYPSEIKVLFSSSVRWRTPVAPFWNVKKKHIVCFLGFFLEMYFNTYWLAWNKWSLNRMSRCWIGMCKNNFGRGHGGHWGHWRRTWGRSNNGSDWRSNCCLIWSHFWYWNTWNADNITVIMALTLKSRNSWFLDKNIKTITYMFLDSSHGPIWLSNTVFVDYNVDYSK